MDENINKCFHDVNNSLGIAVGYIEMLGETNLSEQQQRCVETLNKAIRMTAKRVNNTYCMIKETFDQK